MIRFAIFLFALLPVAIASGQPVVYDYLKFNGKAESLGKEGFFYLAPDKFTKGGWDDPIQPMMLYDALASAPPGTTHIVLDIEGWPRVAGDLVRGEIVRMAKASSLHKIGLHNLAPAPTRARTTDLQIRNWQNQWRTRADLARQCEFATIAMYFNGENQTAADWWEVHRYRVQEARQIYGNKPVFVVLSPHPFPAGEPASEMFAKFVSVETWNEALTLAGNEPIDGIILWSAGALKFRQAWDPQWPWVQSTRARLDAKQRLLPVMFEAPAK